MEQKKLTLRDKVLLLDLKPRNAPDGIKPATFGKWLRAVKKKEDIGEIATAYLNLLCDGLLNSDGSMVVQPEEPVVVQTGASPIATPHPPVNCMAGTFIMRDGKRVFNLDGTFWTGGSDGVIAINGVEYEYPEKNFGNFKKKKQYGFS